MMTCTSDRSGSASSGVRSSDQTPQAATISVASSTRKRFAIDQRISAAIIGSAPRARSTLARHAVGAHREREPNLARRWQAPRRGSDGSANPIVIEAHSIEGIGPCASVTELVVERDYPTFATVLANRYVTAGISCMRVAVARRLASESIRNWPETTTAGRLEAALDLALPSLSSPTSTSTGRKLPSPSASITTVRVPVLITASVGTTQGFARRGFERRRLTNMPGASASRGWRARRAP